MLELVGESTPFAYLSAAYFTETLGKTLSRRITEMAEKEGSSVSNEQSTAAQSAQSGLTAPSADQHSVLQNVFSYTSLDSNTDRTVQPFPRSPKLKKKIANAGHQTKEQLSRCLEELQAERSKTEAHIESLKKRRSDLSRSTDVMKQQVRERFENMKAVLKNDEQAVLDSLELDLRQTRARLDQVLKNWKQHQDQVLKNISSIQRALSEGSRVEDEEKGQSDHFSSKKPDASENKIRLNDERLEKLLRTLSSISKQLRAQLQRKTLLLDSSPLMIDRLISHREITVTSGGRGLSYSSSAPSAPEHPLQFDKVCCTLGASPLSAPQSYWEVDVRCSSAWAVGVAYASIERKGRDKGAKLGRNRNSWCVELRNGHLSAWHNDHHVACQGVGQTSLGKVGVWVNYEKGQLVFYDADSMAVLQRFSAAVTSVFDRAHHQFTEPLYAAVRFIRPPENQIWPNHLEICHLNNP